MDTWILRAVVGSEPIWSAADVAVQATSLPLSPRLLIALADWQAFFDEIEGDLSDPEVGEEFLSQGFKIAHAMKRELKGRAIYFDQPLSRELLKIS